MSAAYYAALVHGKQVIVLSGPHPTHDFAIDHHVQAARAGDAPSGYWRPAVLLDTGSPPDTEEEWRRILLTDPLLHAVFELGRRTGQENRS